MNSRQVQGKHRLCVAAVGKPSSLFYSKSAAVEMIAAAIKKPQGFSTVHTGKRTYPLCSRIISNNLVIQSFEMQFCGLCYV